MKKSNTILNRNYVTEVINSVMCAFYSDDTKWQ